MLLPDAAQATINGAVAAGLPVLRLRARHGDDERRRRTRVPLSAANAATTAEVTISFEALPSDNWSANLSATGAAPTSATRSCCA